MCEVPTQQLHPLTAWAVLPTSGTATNTKDCLFSHAPTVTSTSETHVPKVGIEVRPEFNLIQAHPQACILTHK